MTFFRHIVDPQRLYSSIVDVSGLVKGSKGQANGAPIPEEGINVQGNSARIGNDGPPVIPGYRH